jgi:hypothetical protein
MYLTGIGGALWRSAMGELADLAKKGDKILTFACDGELCDTVYEVTGKSRSVIVLVEVKTGKPHRVHKSRVAKIIQPEGMKEVQEVMEATKDATKEKKAKRAAKPKEKPERVNFKEFTDAGCEVWSKKVEFGDKDGKPIDNVTAEAHCVIAADKKSYRVFNTFNGSLGKQAKKKRDKAPLGVEYKLADDKAYEKKTKDLKKKGYKRRPTGKKK